MDGQAVKSGSNSDRFFLHINTPKRVEVAVTAEDGVTRRVYAVTATHAPVAELRDLSVSQVKLHPFFSGLHADYRAWVAHGVEKVRVTPTNRHAKGTITVNGKEVASGAASGEIALTEGENVITVQITAPDNYTSRSYTVRVVRASAAASVDATLRGLAVYTATGKQPDAANQVGYAGSAYTLTPTLTAGVYDYRVRVPDAVVRTARAAEEHVYVTAVPTTTAPGAKSIVVSGKRSTEEAREPKGEVVSGEASGPWMTFAGYGLITVTVTSLDGSSEQTYRVLVERGSVDDPRGVSVTPGDGTLTLSWDALTGSNAPELYWARWREAGTATWLNRATLRGWKTAYGDDAPRGTAADGQRMHSTRTTDTITGLTNGTEYEVELRGTRGGDTSYGVTNWLKSRWVSVRGTPGQAAQPAQTLTITPSSPTREYGGVDDLSYTVSGLVDGDAAGDVVSGALSRAAGNDAGTYAVGMGTLAIATAYGDKYTLPSAPAITTYTITPKTITAVSGVTVNRRASDGTTAATFDTSAAQGVGVLSAELADFRSGGLQVSGAFPAATPGTHSLSVTYSLRDQGTFKVANYTLSATTATLQGELTEVAACGTGLALATHGLAAEGGHPVIVIVVLTQPAGPDGVEVTLTTSGTATAGDDYILTDATVTIGAGATTGTDAIFVIDDAVDDDNETIILNATVVSSSLTALPLTLTITITDNDDAPAPTPVADSGCPTPAGGDYDADNDGLIEVCNLAQFKAIEADLNGDGSPIRSHGKPNYAGAFPNAAAGMGCPASGCVGYELTADLDIGNLNRPCKGIWPKIGNNNSRFYPIGGWGNDEPDVFSAIFEGNDHTIRNFWVSGFYPGAGLFSVLNAGGVIRNLRLEHANVAGRNRAGGLVGINHGAISNVHVIGGCVAGKTGSGGLVGLNSSTGVITGSSSVGGSDVKGVDIRLVGGRDTGGLVGHNAGSIRNSYSTATVIVDASDNTGGLVGYNSGTIRVSYATGNVRSRVMDVGRLRGRYLGGLAGRNHGDIIASYSTGRVSDGLFMGGLVGVYGSGTVTASYWNTETSHQNLSAQGVGKTTAELQTPTGYTGIYADWNVDLDGDSRGDAPWDFGTASQYPTLNLSEQRAQTPANRDPTVPAALPDATIVNESGTKQVSLSGVFSDANHDSLTVTAGSDDEAVATVAVSSDYSTLTVSA